MLSCRPTFTLLHFNTLPICAVAGSADPTPEAPFGFLLFSFQRSISYVLHSHPSYICACFEGTLVIFDIYDFLDGRCVYLYGYLYFVGNNLFIQQQSYHTKDLCCLVPHLLCFCFTPCIPLSVLPARLGLKAAALAWLEAALAFRNPRPGQSRRSGLGPGLARPGPRLF